jgi:phosphoglycerate dehydrogenase-like enzyme
VNVARGELVDTHAVVREVRAGRLRGALDVTDPEPLPPGHPLRNRPGALITPHVAAFTEAFSPMTIDFLRRQLYRYQRGEELHNVVLTTTGAEAGEQAA